MSKIENGPTARVLRDDELDAVNGGYHDVEAFGAPRPSCPRIRAITMIPP